MTVNTKYTDETLVMSIGLILDIKEEFGTKNPNSLKEKDIEEYAMDLKEYIISYMDGETVLKGKKNYFTLGKIDYDWSVEDGPYSKDRIQFTYTINVDEIFLYDMYKPLEDITTQLEQLDSTDSYKFDLKNVSVEFL